MAEMEAQPVMPGQLAINVPVMQREKFADCVGVSVEVVTGWIDRGYLPTVKIGRHRLINLVMLVKECAESEK